MGGSVMDNLIVSNDSYHQLITNDFSRTMYEELTSSLSNCRSFLFSVAFINYSGLQLLLRALTESENKNIKGKVITSDYLNFTDTKSLRKLKEFKNIDTKIYLAQHDRGFHSKAYIFEYEDSYKIIVGSSNITQSALKSNVEWNVKIITKADHPFTVKVIHEFEELWLETTVIDDRFLTEYERLIQMINESNEKEKEIFYQDHEIIANTMQIKAIENLRWLREHGEKRALVVAATATGKTYMSAFDVKHYKPNRVLFIVHREDILNKAEISFKKILGAGIETGFLTGSRRDVSKRYLFSTIQTLSKHYQEFSQDEFDYIIFDEAHHACAPTYRNVMEYFKPKFTLGMTATPERMDEMNLFDLFDNNIALEIRLREAMETNLVVPFHYFGVTEVDGINLENVDIENADEMTRILCVSSRVEYVIEKMVHYGFDGNRRKILGFCASIAHAEYMAEQFNLRGISSHCVTGQTDVRERERILNELESDSDPLEVVFTINVFNEGIDIPSVNEILLLRPTNSAIVFIQQLGRGMRKFKNKEYLTVLDFIGNYRRSFLIAIALSGSRYYDKDSLKVSVKEDFRDIPGPSYVQMDTIAKERILKQLELENFNSTQYLREELKAFQAQIRRTPYFLVDYESFDGSPDPIKFMDKKGSYYDFICGSLAANDEFCVYKNDAEFLKLIRQLSFFLPLKRPHEFVLLKSLIETSITKTDFVTKMKSHLETVDLSTCVHAIDNLLLKFKDNSQRNRSFKMIRINDDNIETTHDFNLQLSTQLKRRIIVDILQYGLVRYQREFGNTNYGIPFFKLFQQYQMVDAALLSNFEKAHSSYRGAGLLANGSDLFLFVDLKKDAKIRPEIDYDDVLYSPDQFQWQTPNNTKPSSERGKNVIFNKERGIHLHLFVRKLRNLDKAIQTYIYLGETESVSYKGTQPITVQMKILNTIPNSLFTELTTNVVVELNNKERT